MPQRRVDAVLERLKRLHPKVIDLELGRTQRLLARLGHPERILPPVVHVAGTNGKGSTVAYLRAIAEAAGQRTHVYTSPHLVRFAERIRINGQIIEEAALAELLAECEAANDGHAITFFEITTVAAFLAFARHPVDLCLVETGLGGRFDATNVVERPALTVLTPISLDHQAFLGDNLTAITREKAGILKPGVPCVSSRQPPEALAVILRQAEALSVPLLLEGRDWTVTPTTEGCLVTEDGKSLSLPPPALPGMHQIGNAGLAVVAARQLDRELGRPPVPAAVSGDGLRRAEWPARLQRLSRGPLVTALPTGWELWLDGGHNPDAGKALAEFAASHWADRSFDAIVGMLNSKDSLGFLRPLGPLLRSLRTVAIPGEANSRTAAEMAEAASAEGIQARAQPDLSAALGDLARGRGPARILICGSLYLAGVVLRDNA